MRHPERSLSFKSGVLKGNPFAQGSTPVQVLARGRKLQGWELYDGAAGPFPPGPITSREPEEDLVLIPFGAARLRITEFPVLK